MEVWEHVQKWKQTWKEFLNSKHSNERPFPMILYHLFQLSKRIQFSKHFKILVLQIVFLLIPLHACNYICSPPFVLESTDKKRQRRISWTNLTIPCKEPQIKRKFPSFGRSATLLTVINTRIVPWISIAYWTLYSQAPKW